MKAQSEGQETGKCGGLDQPPGTRGSFEKNPSEGLEAGARGGLDQKTGEGRETGKRIGFA